MRRALGLTIVATLAGIVLQCSSDKAILGDGRFVDRWPADIGAKRGECSGCMGTPDACVVACSGKECGDNGCGSSCGSCGSGKTCDALGQCKETCGVPPQCKMIITIELVGGNTYSGTLSFLAPSDACSRSVTAGVTDITLGDFTGRYAVCDTTSPRLAIAMAIPASIITPGTYPSSGGYAASWVLQQVPFDIEGGYVFELGTTSTLQITHIERTPGGRLAGKLSSSLIHSGTKAKALGTFDFDVILK